MKKPVLLILILMFVILILSVVRIFVSNKISTSGVVLGQIQEEIDNYKTQNMLISQKVYEYSSLTNIASKAAELGYTDQNTAFVLSGQIPVAFKQ